MTLRIAAIASGTGSNVAAIQGHIEAGRLDARIVVILSNNPEAKVLEFGRSRGIPVWAQSHKGTPREAFDALLVAEAKRHGADTIALAGYMRLVTPVLLEAFAGRVVNVHPALLPSFPGVHGAADAVAYGVRFSGVTVHFVDGGVDTGPVIVQAVTPVGGEDTEDTLMQRLHAFEHVLYAQALQWLAQGRLRVQGRRVLLAPVAETAGSGANAGAGGNAGAGVNAGADSKAGAGANAGASAAVKAEGQNLVLPGQGATLHCQHGLGSAGANSLGPWIVSPPLELT